MKKFIFLLIATLGLAISAQTPQEAYIQNFSEIAVAEMYRSGIPASITLAQGLLESSAGRSYLASKANNHFGIKCHKDWKGETAYHDDDAKNECFRKYKEAAESYRDHSDFLRYRDRYKFLFDYELTDYRSWAHGLKKAGYATDPAYAQKLIQLIEKYDLQRFDKVQLPAQTPTKPQNKNQEVVEIPQSPLRLEEAEKIDERSGEFTFSLQRPVYMKNGVPFVYAMEGETYEDIADSFNLFVAEIYRFNDLKKGSREPLPGEVVYVQAKKKNTKRGLDKHVVDAPDETLWGISQRYGVTLKSILKRNALTEDYFLAEGDVIKLR